MQIFPPDRISIKANGVKPVSESNRKPVCSTCRLCTRSTAQETVYYYAEKKKALSKGGKVNN